MDEESILHCVKPEDVDYRVLALKVEFHFQKLSGILLDDRSKVNNMLEYMFNKMR